MALDSLVQSRAHNKFKYLYPLEIGALFCVVNDLRENKGYNCRAAGIALQLWDSLVKDGFNTAILQYK